MTAIKYMRIDGFCSLLRAFYQLSCLARGWGWFVLAAKLEELKPREETKKYVLVTLNMRIDCEIEVNLFFYSFIFVKKYVFVTHGVRRSV